MSAMTIQKGLTDRLLKLVSRSFALCIPKLPPEVRSEVGNYYLLCRYADSIEDSSLSLSEKEACMQSFFRALRKEDTAALVTVEKKVLPHISAEHDKVLIQEFVGVFEEFTTFDSTSKRIALHWLEEMMEGMLLYSKKEVKTFLDLDNYCYYVAGTVGNYLTEVFCHKCELDTSEELMARSVDFGRVLQKVNIIRDFSKDHAEGRVYWPKELFARNRLKVDDVFEKEKLPVSQRLLDEMVKDATAGLLRAVEYIELIPTKWKGLRVFCAIPLYMAVLTLLKCHGNQDIFAPGRVVKISKRQTMSLMASIERKICLPEFPMEYFHLLLQNAPKALQPQPALR